MQENAVWIAIALVAVVYIVATRMGKVAPAEARRLVQEGAVLLDVRSIGEFSAGHIPGAINIPVDQVAARADELAAKGKSIVVYCASGMRSGAAARMLKSKGITVFDLGGMSRW
jgi:phage shock protein E